MGKIKESEQRPAGPRCTIGKEQRCGGRHCSRCGWWPEEENRRKALPFVKGEDGLWKKLI